jgi:hypothetical protein
VDHLCHLEPKTIPSPCCQLGALESIEPKFGEKKEQLPGIQKKDS